MNISTIIRGAVDLSRRNAPLLLTGTAVAGVIATAIFAGKASLKAREAIIDDATEQWSQSDQDNDHPGNYYPASVVDAVKVTWRIWVPTVASAALTVTSIVLIHTTHKKRYAALVGLYALGEKAFQEYREAVDETADQKTKDAVKEKVAQKVFDRENDPFDHKPERGRGGDSLFIDGYTGRWFSSDLQTIRASVNDFNKSLIEDFRLSLNDFYSFLDLGTVEVGNDVGWNSDKLLEVTFVPLLDQWDRPYTVVHYNTRPQFNYYYTH